MTELPKTFDPAAIEARWYQHWETGGLFRPERSDAEPFTIVIPPPNVTGSLHIGHALDMTLQDILVRHARLQGKDALWVVGTDHAGIATQMVVERNLESQGLKRQEIGREAFLEHVWEWKAQSGGAITRQLRRLGASCDWSREQFTMDPHFVQAVNKVFVQLHRDGLLYRDKRLVNWDPRFQTAISDLEVETREVQGKFWHLRYPLEDGSGHILVATTRPETMLADMAVAVHPDDDRYAGLIGKRVRLPITGRLVPIVADAHTDPALGSGAVKITPGHDFNDFEVGRRAGFKPAEMLNMLDAQARVIQCGGIPENLLGLDRFDARARVVELLEESGFLERVEDRVIQTPYGDRSGVVIEPWLTDQWYVDAATLARPAIDAVRSGAIRVVPKTWEKTWFQWLENIQPWCVSRQLWWGHQVPAWYDERGTAFVAETEAEAQAIAGAGVPLRRDPDVLDTWFSSALWPFATLGWPEESSPLQGRGGSGEAAEGEGGIAPPSHVPSPQPSPLKGRGSLLAKHYPNDVLVSGFDIIFFWDARMAMQGLHFMGEVPWKTLYLHGLVRDAKGQKMSKSKGNTVDPLGLIDRYGADALRFTLAAMESQGRDIKLDEKRVEGYRNFATKLWNAARFCQANAIGASATIEPPAAELPVNRWIVGETVRTVQALDLALAEFRFDESANTIYHFTWSTFCDWYLELIKPILSPLPPAGGDQGVGASDSAQPTDEPTPDRSREREGSNADETRAVAAWVLDQILVMLHPFMPFITEELWHAMGARPYPLILAQWPMPDARALDPAAELEMKKVMSFIQQVRSLRNDYNVPPASKVGYVQVGAGMTEDTVLARNKGSIQRMSRSYRVGFESGWEDIGSGSYEASDQEFTDSSIIQHQGVQFTVLDSVYALLLKEHIDVAAERARLSKALAAAEKERDALASRLANASFVERAKPEAVAKAREDYGERAAEAERLAAALGRLG